MLALFLFVFTRCAAVRMCWRFFCLFLLAVHAFFVFFLLAKILFFACTHAHAALSVSVPAFCLLCCRFFSLFCFTHQILFYAYHTHIIKMSDGGLLLCNDVMHSSILSAWFCCGLQIRGLLHQFCPCSFCFFIILFGNYVRQFY